MANVKALRVGVRSGPNAAGASEVVHHSQLAENSLTHARELEVVIHGEPMPDPAGGTGRYIRPGESAPRADVGIVGVASGDKTPPLRISPEEMARRLTEAGFGQGRWTRYRVRLVMCFGGVGESESYASRLSAAMAARNVETEVLGGTGRVSATGPKEGAYEPVPPGENRPKAAARPQPGVPQAEEAYYDGFTFPNRRPGTGWARHQAAPGTKSPTGAAEPIRPTTEPAVPATQKPAVPAAEPAGMPPSATVKVIPRRGTAARVGVGAGAAKLLGPMILDMVTGYFIAKHEEKRIEAAITATLQAAPVQRRIVELVEQQRMEIAYQQLRGTQLFATVSLRLALTNGVLDAVEVSRTAITDTDQTNSMVTVISDDPIFMTENSRRWEQVSVPLPAVPISESEHLRLQLRAHDEAGAPSDPAAAGAHHAERTRLRSDIQRAERQEERARLEEIARPGVLSDPEERSRQQADIAERLRRLNEQDGPPANRPQGRPPGTAAAQPTLLPGAPGASPIDRAASAVQQAEVWTQRLQETGSALERRLGSENSPTESERQAFLAEELSWRLAMKGFMNHFQSEARPEAVTAWASWSTGSGEGSARSASISGESDEP